MNERVRIGIAEAVGTMILVVGGPGTAILATGHFTGSMSSVGILGVALAFGLSLLVAAYAFKVSRQQVKEKLNDFLE